MNGAELLEVNDDVLTHVIHSLHYGSKKALENDVQTVTKWLEMQKHLPEIMDARRIQNFLFLNKGDIERTKEKINKYYTVRSELPDIFGEINPNLPHMQQFLDTYYVLPLPKLTEDKFRVIFYRVRNKKLASRKDHIRSIRYLVNLQEIRITEDITNGDIFIFDGIDTPLRLMLGLRPHLIYKALIQIYKKVFSNRLKAVYIFNAPPLTSVLVTILKTIMKPKLLNRIHFCSNENFLIELFGKKMIPKDYGGDEKSLEELRQLMKEKFVQYAERFNELDVLRVKPKHDDKNHNFKQLEID